MDNIKKCTICNIEKPFSDYYSFNNGQKYQAACKACQSIRNKERYLKNRDKFKSFALVWQRKNPDKKRAYRQNLRNRNLLNPPNTKNGFKVCSACKKEKPFNEFYKDMSVVCGMSQRCKICVSEAHKKSYSNKHTHKKKTPEQIESEKKSKAKYYQKNKEKYAQYCEKYRQTEKGQVVRKKVSASRRAKIKGCHIEKINPIDVFKRDLYICQSCGCKTRPDFKNINHPKYPNLDHIIPLSKGGTHTMINTQCLCRQCNIEKGNGQKNDQLLLFAY